MSQKNAILSKIDEKPYDISTLGKTGLMKKLKKTKRIIKQNIELDRDRENFKLHFEKAHPRFFELLDSEYPEHTP